MISLNSIPLHPSITLIWRLAMAVGGGFILTSLFCVWLSQQLHTILGAQVTSVFIWCLLSGFALYCALIMWLVGTTKLGRTSAIICLTGLILWFSLTPVGVPA
ncbi:hypothetical protein [Neptunicella sp. SCSIO 80796]|uniref:hypothetical protein n=1 Tax=Neptunicella plasticusilytica TaxID=3117012 RepID=UPI003A4DFC52